MATEPTDQELVAEVRRGSQHAMASLYDRYARSMYSLALYMLRDARGAEDVVQDVFLTFWQHPESYVSERGPLGPWLLRVTRNRAIDILRRRGREQHPDEERVAALEERVVDPDPEPGEQVWSREVAARVRAALAELSDAQRQVIELAYFRGMTQSQMAEYLDTPLGTIKTRVRTALQRLAEIMADSEVWTDVP